MIVIIANKKKYLSIEEGVELASEVKDALKESDIAEEVCKENGFDLDIIDGIVIKFDDLDTSAKTVNGEITLNNELITEDFDTIMRYAIHELVHVFQHMDREGKGDPYEDYEYLDRPDEEEAFQVQIEFEAEEGGKDKVEKYVDDLLDYHDVPEEKKEEKRKELLERVEE